MKNYISISVFAMCFVVVQPCFAAQNEGSTEGADEIIVTATRQAMPAKDYAGSVSGLSEERLQLVAPVHPAELLNEVAGVNIHRGSGQEHLTAIRSPVLTGGAGAGSFLYLEDGVPLRAAGFSNVNGLFEGALELAGGVEVTKGPGSVLYGSNAVHGLVNILSQAPTDNRDLSFDVLASNDDFARVKAASNGSAFSGRYRVSVNLTHDGGFREASGFDQQKLQIRHDVDVGAWSVKTLATLQNLNQETAGFIRGFEAYKDADIAGTNPNPEAFRDGKSARIAVHLTKAAGGGKTLSFIPYGRWVDLSFRRHFVPGKALEDSGHKSIGLLSSLAGTTSFGGYTLGFDSEYTDGFLREFQPGPSVFSFIQGEHFDYTVKAVALSPYAQIRLDLNPRTKINIGARADYTSYDYNNNIDDGQFGRFIRSPDRQDDFFVLTPKAGITHQLTDTLTAYGRIARGARAPQTADAYSLQLGQVAGEIKPETLDSLEFGLKGKSGDINFELAAFAMRKENFFFRNADGFNVVDGKTNHKGLELSFDAPLSDMFDLMGGFTLAEHTYAFTDIVGRASSSITKGDQVDTAPNTLGFLQITARPSDNFSMSLKLQHVGSYYTDPGNTAKYTGHNIFTLRANYALNRHINVYGRVDNLGNTDYANRADFAFGSDRYFPGRPRTLFLGVTYKE
ncbi:MAG: TonB-dependent receptor [Robiginitomaculum sp.]|nr:TonB-dependent receptor [Robiginitomaculum sp.]